MLTKIRNKKGFTLIELMIVVAIIAILAAIAIPNFLKFQAKSKQSEARTLLTGIYEAELAYFATENIFGDGGTYGAVGDGLASAPYIGFEPASAPKYYSWEIVTVSAYGFTASASGNIDRDLALDRWLEHEDAREPCNRFDDVSDLSKDCPYVD
jgi:prepilin-type N-terminal cleavage/methylation domain-containing protein